MSYSNYDQTIVINGLKLGGVQSIDASYGINESPVNVAGVGFVGSIINSPLEGNFNISRVMVGSDPFLETNSLGKYKFDEQEISGAILYDNNSKGFGFTKGRLSRYSIACSVGQIPETQVDINIYGQLGKNVLTVDPYLINKNFNLYINYFPNNVYFTDINGAILEDEDVISSWSNGTLLISETKYDSLNARTRILEEQKVMALGKDAFKFNGYGNLITEEEIPIRYPDQSSMKVRVSDFEIDAVSDFSYSRSINLTPIYAIPKGRDGGVIQQNIDPVQVNTEYPIETDINITLIVDQYEIRQMKDRLQSPVESSVEIDIFDADSPDEIINSFTGYNVKLISESINSSVGQEMSVSMTFKGYESLHNQFYLS